MDYREIVKALRAKADSTEFVAERVALLVKAQEIEDKHGKFRYSDKEIFIAFAKEDKLFAEMLGFPGDWYDTMDEWWDIDVGSGAELKAKVG